MAVVAGGGCGIDGERTIHSLRLPPHVWETLRCLKTAALADNFGRLLAGGFPARAGRGDVYVSGGNA